MQTLQLNIIACECQLANADRFFAYAYDSKLLELHR